MVVVSEKGWNNMGRGQKNMRKGIVEETKVSKFGRFQDPKDSETTQIL